jgi:galactokinase
VIELAWIGPGDRRSARLTGAGFGGCVVALAWPAWAGRLGEWIASEFAAQYGYAPEIIITGAAAGAELL